MALISRGGFTPRTEILFPGIYFFVDLQPGESSKTFFLRTSAIDSQFALGVHNATIEDVVSQKVSPRGSQNDSPTPEARPVGSLLPGHGWVRKGRARPSGGSAADREGLGASRSALDEATHT